MPKNTGGNKARRGRKDGGSSKSKIIPLPETEDDSHVGHITKVHGDCRFDAQIITSTGVSKTVLVHLSKGKKKLGRVVNGSFILFSIREYEEKGDILYLYNPDEVSYLKKSGEIVDPETLTETGVTGFDFSAETGSSTIEMGGEMNLDFV
jgi:hypothetical protein